MKKKYNLVQVGLTYRGHPIKHKEKAIMAVALIADNCGFQMELIEHVDIGAWLVHFPKNLLKIFLKDEHVEFKRDGYVLEAEMP